MNLLLDTLYRQALVHGTRVALQGDTITLTYAAVWDAVNAVSADLRALGVRRTGLCGDNSPAWVVADLACRLAGIVTVPVPGFFTPDQVAHVFSQAGLEGLILTDTTPCVAAEEDAPRCALPFPALQYLTLGATATPQALPAGTQKITFTSGSTGHPKGVCLAQHQLDATAVALKKRLQDLNLRRHLCVLPLATLLENVAGVYLPLLLGATIHLPSLRRLGFTGSSQVDTEAFVRGIKDVRPDSLILVPELARILVQAAAQEHFDGTDLKFVAVGGGKVAPGLLQQAQALRLPLHEGYGLSECGSVVALNTPACNQPGSVGQVLDHVQVQCRTDGEIEISGNTFLGYLGETPTDSRNPLATGDLGSLDPAGFLRVQGRSKNVLITAFGRNVSPEWLESELLQASGAMQAFVFGDGQTRLRAWLAGPPGAAPASLEQHLIALNQRLPDYARLAQVFWLPRPLTPDSGLLTGNGRMQRQSILQALPRLLLDASPCHIHESGEHTMSFFHTLQQATANERQRVQQAPVIEAIRAGRLGLDGYVYFLSQAYHHVKHTAPLMMACGGRLPERLEFVRKALVEYIEEEYGHHEWILNDIRACGADVEAVRHGEADMPIRLMVAYLYDQMQRGNPMALFGMVQVLEGSSVELATPLGQAIQQRLGLPNQAFSYLYSHGALDQEHFVFFHDLMDAVTDAADQKAILDAARICYRLYGDMLHAIPLQNSEEIRYDAVA